MSPTSGTPAGEGTRLRLRVAPGARRSEVVGRHGEAWKVRVRSAPERGRANDEVVRLLAEVLGVSARDVAVIAGHTSRDKVVALDGLTSDEASTRLSASVAA